MRRRDAPLPIAPHGFWNNPAVLALLVLATAIPLLPLPIPPLTDLPGHMARYYVELNLHTSPYLQRYFDFHWALIGNLGVDLLIIPMAKLFGLDIGLKLIVIAIPILLATGFLWTAHELHGRIPPTALFALPLTYHFAFQYGFLNFSLSAALCFLAFAFWLRLERAGRLRLRAALFVPIAALIWTAHVYGWGMLGVLVYATEVVRMRHQGRAWLKSLAIGAVHTLPLCLPFLLMILWRSGDVRGFTGDWQWQAKGMWPISILRERWQDWDIVGAMLLWLLVLAALLGFGLRMRANMRLAVLLLALLYAAMPRVLIGSGFADMRLAAFVAAAGILGIRCDGSSSSGFSKAVAAAALVFFAGRIAVTTGDFAAISRKWHEQLAALPSIERGSRVLLLARIPCRDQWGNDRLDHVGSLVLPRREAFSNSQWALAGAQLLQVKYRAGAPFVVDPSHFARPNRCGDGQARIRLAASVAPRAFDYLWLVDAPAAEWPHDPRLIAVWHDKRGILYRVAR